MQQAVEIGPNLDSLRQLGFGWWEWKIHERESALEWRIFRTTEVNVGVLGVFSTPPSATLHTCASVVFMNISRVDKPCDVPDHFDSKGSFQSSPISLGP